MGSGRVPSSCRLCLVTLPALSPDAFAPALDAALAAGDVASLIIANEAASPAALQRIAEVLVPIAQRRGVAALIHNDSRIAGRVGADGVHIDTGTAELRDAVARLRPVRIVGAGGLKTRHEAMEAGEAEPDYVFFGRPAGDAQPSVHPDALDLAAWWAPLFEIPAVLMGGSTVASVEEATATGVEFVALRRAVWEGRDGPAAAVAEANRRLGSAGVKAA